MLEFLHIKNLALIEEIQLDFTKGMNVLTGETGAGKSFIIKALNFVLGDKLETSMIRPNSEKAEVQAIFVNNNEEIILRRELIAETGRSRFFLNGNLTSQEAIKSLRQNLLLHASQHGQQKLLQANYQAKLIDDYLEDTYKTALEEKNNLLKKLAKKRKNLLHELTTYVTGVNYLKANKKVLQK